MHPFNKKRRKIFKTQRELNIQLLRDFGFWLSNDNQTTDKPKEADEQSSEGEARIGQ